MNSIRLIGQIMSYNVEAERIAGLVMEWSRDRGAGPRHSPLLTQPTNFSQKSLDQPKFYQITDKSVKRTVKWPCLALE